MLSTSDYNILRLIRSENVGNIMFFKLLKFFGSCENAIENIDEYSKKYKVKNKIVIASKEKIDLEIVGCSTIGAKIITYKNELYPELLRNISNFPPVLTTLGNVELFKRKSVSIVGSRNASANGKNFAKRIAQELGEAGYVITSGFASGIDTSAHEGALKTGTIAVLGGGIDNIYPRGNEALYYQIKNQGLIVSEVPFNSSPKAENFPSRNRIVSGLSYGIIVAEASLKSGTLHTARQALEQGRELMVVPGSPYDSRSEGTNKLLKEGASPITCSDDIIYALQDFKIRDEYNSLLKDVEDNSFEDEIEEEVENIEDELITEENMTLQEIIVSRLNYTPIDIEEFSLDLKISTNILNAELIELELEGKIAIENGGVRLS